MCDVSPRRRDAEVAQGGSAHTTRRANTLGRGREGGLACGEALSHPDITIKCSLTLCCKERGIQEKRHSSPVKEYGFGGLGTARGMENNSCITLQQFSPIACMRPL